MGPLAGRGTTYYFTFISIKRRRGRLQDTQSLWSLFEKKTYKRTSKTLSLPKPVGMNIPVDPPRFSENSRAGGGDIHTNSMVKCPQATAGLFLL